MNMEDFNCDTFNVSFSFSAGDFDKAAYLLASKIEDESKYKDDEGDLVFRVFLSSKKDITKQHGHLRIFVRPDTSGRVGFDVHRPGAKPIKKAPPYLEDAMKWLGKFFSKKEFTGRVDVDYEFEKGFETTIPLPFPLTASSKKLAGLKVSGLALEFPPESDVLKAIVQRRTDGSHWIFLQEAVLINLDTFDLYKELRKLKSTTTSLIRKRDGNNEVASRKTKTPRA